MRKSKIQYVCLDCKYSFSIEYKGWYPSIQCIKCGGVAWMKDLAKSDLQNIHVKKYKEPVAFFKDNKGRTYGVDKKGNKIDPSETRYDLKHDPHGWKAAGYKVRSHDAKGRPNI